MKQKIELFGENIEALSQLGVHVFFEDKVSGTLCAYKHYPNLWAFYLSCDQWRGFLWPSAVFRSRVFTEFLCGLIVGPRLKWIETQEATFSSAPFIWQFLTQKSSSSSMGPIKRALDLGVVGSKEEFLHQARTFLLELIEEWGGVDEGFHLAIGSTQAEEIFQLKRCSSEVGSQLKLKLDSVGYFQTIWQVSVDTTNTSEDFIGTRLMKEDLGKTVFQTEALARRALLDLKHKLEGVCEDVLTLRSLRVRYDGIVSDYVVC